MKEKISAGKTSVAKKRHTAYEEIMDRMTDPLVALDKKWKYIYVNRAAERSIGLPSEELLGKNIWQLFKKQNVLRLKERCLKAMTTQQYAYHELYSNTHQKWLGNHIYPSSQGVTILFRDITVNKKTEDDYHKLAQRNGQLLDAMLDIFSLADEDMNIVDVNPAFCRTMGYTKKELLRMNLSDLHINYSREELAARYKEVVQKKKVLLDTKQQTKKGKILDIETAIIEMSIDGQAYFASFGRDVSLFKKAEEQIINEKNLSDSIINSLPGIFFLFDEKGKMLRWNRRTQTISDYSAKEIAQMHPADFYAPDEKELITAKIREAFENGSAEVEANIFTRHKEKIPFYFHGRVTYIGGEKCLVGTGINISQLTKAKEELHRIQQEVLNQQVEEQKKISRAIINAQEKERNFIGREMHDNVNQLLATARLYLGIGAKKNEQIREHVAYPVELLDHAITEIRSLSHKYVVPLQNVDLHQLILTLMHNLEKTACVKTTLEYKVARPIHDDELKINLYRILQEQVTNITRHAEATEAFVSVKDKNGCICLHIKDNGKGFDPAVKNKGVGLVNILNRINSFNGDMKIKTAPGKGCETKIRIPF